MTMNRDVQVSTEEKATFIQSLAERFEENEERHKEVEWSTIEEKLLQDDTLLLTVYQMEQTGGEPDVLIFPPDGRIAFVDCAKESPKGRRSVCYDKEAREGRKKFPPEMSAMEEAQQIGMELLTEADYRYLQSLESFDEKTSSWLQTPEPIRHLGGAIFGDRRYNQVFIYHNGADSYYAARGYRGKVFLT